MPLLFWQIKRNCNCRNVMKIVHCIFSFNTGGAELMLCDIIRRQSVDNNVTLIVVNKEYDQTLLTTLPNNVKVILMNRTPSSKNPAFVIKLNYLLRQLKPDIVHVHSYQLPGIIWRMRQKVLYTVHTVGIPMKYSRKLRGVIAISKAVEADITGRCKCKIYTVPNGIELEEIARKSDYQLTDKFRVVQIARLDQAKKGQDLLIEAVAVLKSKGINNIQVDFIGEGSSASSLKEIAEKLEISDRINFLGKKDRKYIYSHLKDYDLMCHPARYEGFGLVIAEGMAAGLPVLVSDEGGPLEIIKHGEFGYYFKNGNLGNLIEKLKSLISEYHSAVEKVGRAKDYVSQNYSVKRMVEEYNAIYSKCID